MKNQINAFLVAISVVILCSCETYELSEPALLVPLTVTENPSLPSIDVNGTSLHSETFGNPDDPIVVAIHGGPGADYRSILNCRNFADDGYYVVFYDQRGSGLSERHDANVYTMQVFIDDLKAVIEYYISDQEQKVILMGHSWGAMLATAYVDQYPQEIAGLVLMEPGGFTWDQTLEYVGRTRTMKLFSENVNDFMYLDQLITGDQHNTLDYKENLRLSASFSEDNSVGNAGPYPFWRSGAVCSSATMKFAEENSFDFTSNLSQYSNKVLFAFSELNESYGVEHAELVSAPFPNVQLVEIIGTGHEIPYFGWQNYYPVAKAYLDEINQ